MRLGASHAAPRASVRAVKFGLVHAVIGIPIGAALALSIGGWYFTWAYLRGYRARRSAGRAPREHALASRLQRHHRGARCSWRSIIESLAT